MQEICDVDFVDAEKVARVAGKLADNTNIYELCETFKLLGDPTRLKIIMALNETEMCVCDLASLLSVTRSAVSHQLRLLRNLRLVKYRRDGKIVYYSLDDAHVSGLLSLAIEHTRES